MGLIFSLWAVRSFHLVEGETYNSVFDDTILFEQWQSCWDMCFHEELLEFCLCDTFSEEVVDTELDQFRHLGAASGRNIERSLPTEVTG